MLIGGVPIRKLRQGCRAIFFPENCDQRKRWKREPRIEHAENWSEQVQQANLGKPECLSAQDFAVQPPRRHAGAIEFQHALAFETRGLAYSDELRFRVTAAMPE